MSEPETDRCEVKNCHHPADYVLTGRTSDFPICRDHLTEAAAHVEPKRSLFAAVGDSYLSLVTTLVLISLVILALRFVWSLFQ